MMLLSSASPTQRAWLDRWCWRLLLAMWLGLLAGFSAFRCAFLVKYWGHYSGASAADLALSVLEGVRFDLAVIFTFTGLPALGLLLLSPWRHRRVLAWLLVAMTGAAALGAFVLEGVDLYYYGFVERHISFELAGMANDWRPVTAMIAQGYARPALLILALLLAALALGGVLLRRLVRAPWSPVPWPSRVAQAVALLLVTVLLARGGVQTKVLSENMAFLGSDLALGHLALNPVFTALKALDQRLEMLHYYPDEQAIAETRALIGLQGPPLDARYPLLHRLAAPHGSRAQTRPRPRNLVILTLESFSPQLVGALGGFQGVSPNFDRLAQEGLLFTNFYANGTRSLEGVPAILTGYPALPTTALIGSSLEQSGMSSLPAILKSAGYATLFLHGAYRGSMWFDQFANRSGFERYLAKEDFPLAEAHSDSTWGIFDHYALERLHAELLASPKPCFAFFFSLSSHTPYELPDESWRTFPDREPNAQQLNSFAYTDQALGRFFELARAAPYWRDTVFMITGDHNLGGSGLTRRQAMRIPLLILDPGDPAFPRGRTSAVLGSQVDIAPTALTLLNLGAQTDFVGQSLLAPAARHIALFAWGGQAGWINEQFLVTHDLTRPLAIYRYGDDPGLARNLLTGALSGPEAGAVREFQSYLQTVNNLLVLNRVYPVGPAQ